MKTFIIPFISSEGTLSVQIVDDTEITDTQIKELIESEDCPTEVAVMEHSDPYSIEWSDLNKVLETFGVF